MGASLAAVFGKALVAEEAGFAARTELKAGWIWLIEEMAPICIVIASAS